eukprot:CAMPEP_0184752178 /NCGR_PEP_ID=MMETSP0315-20130426/43441_1 /TAXON_ID=101924 /ORGANISM="Rhodosorus marinus, Strain UTEX LB 2760" /LENGTH=98 /DNA_ID=CAMNT_0027231495 /DNA_START=1326 /DNA_END=1622 /DNA_ORIENTATION=+
MTICRTGGFSSTRILDSPLPIALQAAAPACSMPAFQSTGNLEEFPERDHPSFPTSPINSSPAFLTRLTFLATATTGDLLLLSILPSTPTRDTPTPQFT